VATPRRSQTAYGPFQPHQCEKSRLATEVALLIQGALDRAVGLRAPSNARPITSFFYNLNPKMDLRKHYSPK
jgi:hypothetical protein